jgi:hypothetical protein
MASTAKSELAAFFITAHKMIPHCQTLIDMGWPQPKSLIQTNNSTAAGVVNNTIVPCRSKMMDMRLLFSPSWIFPFYFFATFQLFHLSYFTTSWMLVQGCVDHLRPTTDKPVKMYCYIPSPQNVLVHIGTDHRSSGSQILPNHQ